VPVTVPFDFEGPSRKPSAKKLNRVSDGDTPVIEQPIRMVSCDTPEKSGYAGGPDKAQPKLDACRKRLEGNYYSAIPKELREYLISKLTTNAATKHISAGYDASVEFEKALDERLQKPDGIRKNVAVIPAGEFIDTYGRLLAYIAPWFSGTSGDPIPPKTSPLRRTFNLDMIERGWAAFFPIYPSLPKQDDFNLAIKAAEHAWNNKKGIWKKYGKNVLLAYEYRLCVKLGTAKSAKNGITDAFQRVCVDLSTIEIFDEFGFHQVKPCYRMWIWKKDIEDAKTNLGL
jgi:endonuclease YncB( thermonuclease family)